MTDIKAIQAHNRRVIIMAAHPSKTYNEALEKELDLGCKFYYNAGAGDIKTVISINDLLISYVEDYGSVNSVNTYDIEKTDIIGRPLTLARMAVALKFYCKDELIDLSLNLDRAGQAWIGIDGKTKSFKFNFEMDDLDYQIHETQITFAKLTGWEGE